MTSKRTNPDFVNGVPELLILQLLDRRPMHGYDLVQSIRLASGRQLGFGEGCIYPILHRLEKQGALASARTPVNGRTRIIYRVTAEGRKRLAESRTLWRDMVAVVNSVLEGDARDVSALA